MNIAETMPMKSAINPAVTAYRVYFILTEPKYTAKT